MHTPLSSEIGPSDIKRYTIVFFLTTGIFLVAFLLSDFLYNVRTAQITEIEEGINRNILETEIQYALLADAACEDGANTVPLSIAELNTLATKLAYMEGSRGIDDPEVIALKKDYSLLEIKDYLLQRERAQTCGERISTVMYFYSNKGDCEDCRKMGYVLTDMRDAHDDLHVYSFDFHLGLGAIETLKAIYGLDGELPIVVINRKPYYGYKDREELERLLPELTKTPRNATTTKGLSR